ncbi:MAG: helix-turn-helix transcriptional regulator [Clostridiales bacterium]|nr:helix-turn-helix transcriptional regulator [Clostridiales bacterium]
MTSNEEQFIGILNVLSESVRFRILSLIASRGEITAKDILSEFDFTQPTLSHHMACLTGAGLVNVERKGRFAYYSVNKDTIDLVASGIAALKSEPEKNIKEKAVSADDVKEPKKSRKKKKKDKNKKKKKT